MLAYPASAALVMTDLLGGTLPPPVTAIYTPLIAESTSHTISPPAPHTPSTV